MTWELRKTYFFVLNCFLQAHSIMSIKRPIKQKGAKAIKLVSLIGEATVHNSNAAAADP